MKYGFVKVAAAVPAVRVADVEYNVEEIERLMSLADSQDVELLCFPELSLTAYTCQDLFKEQLLLNKAEYGLMRLLEFSRQLDVITVVGLPVQAGGLLLNCAAVIQNGTLLGVVPKTYLPNYNEFYEKRWFASAQDLNPTDIHLAGSPVTLSAEPKVFQTIDGVKFGVEICEDVWAPIPPSNNLTMAGAEIILNCSTSNELIGKHNYLRSLVAQQSARTMSGYVYSSSGFGESTQDLVYGGNAMIFENGKLLVEGERFSFQPQLQTAQIDVECLRTERHTNSTFINAQRNAHCQLIATKPVGNRDFKLERFIDAHPFIPSDEQMAETCEEILNIQSAGLAKRLVHTNCQHVVIGISGGLDSTLALLVCIRTFDKLGYVRKGIVGVTMPGFGTSGRTHDNAVTLMQLLDISQMEVSISKAVIQHFEDIVHIRGGVEHHIAVMPPELLLDGTRHDAVKGVGQHGVFKPVLIADDGGHQRGSLPGQHSGAGIPHISHFVYELLDPLHGLRRNMPGLSVDHVGHRGGADTRPLGDLLDRYHKTAPFQKSWLRSGYVRFYYKRIRFFWKPE